MKPELKRALGKAQGCVFICSGNMIRSAFAEVYGKHLGVRFELRSAGTLYQNSALHPETSRALAQLGVGARQLSSFRPQLVTELDPLPDDEELVFGMTQAHLADARTQGARGPSFLLNELLGVEREIADPYFDGNFAATFDELASCVEALLQARAD